MMAIFALTGCGPEPDDPIICTVTFDSNGGSAVEAQRIKEGSLVIQPDNPNKDGYSFGGWYTDNGSFANEWDYDDPVTGNITLYAQWVIDSLTSIEVTDSPIAVKKGEPLDLSKIEVTATHNDSHTDVIPAANVHIAGFDPDTIGEQTLTVSYAGQTTTFKVWVIALSKIEVEIIATEEGEPLNYVIVGVGEEIDREDIVVTATWKNDGDDDPDHVITEPLADDAYDIEDFDSNDIGEQEVTVKYGGKTAQFTVRVKAVKEIAVTKQPTRAEYNVGEALDLTGLELTVTFDDDEILIVHGSDLYNDVTGFDNETLGEQTITIEYSGQTETFKVTVLGPYEITGSGTTFTATRANGTATPKTITGASAQPIQTVIEAIRADAKNLACFIQFGNGTTVLDIGDVGIVFNNTGGTWGLVTLSGKITSANNIASNGTISIITPVSVTTSADIANTATTIAPGLTGAFGRAVYNASTGAVTISGGEITSLASQAVVNATTGTLTISGGTIHPEGTNTNQAVINNVAGTINITGGTISGPNQVVRNQQDGPINVSGGTISATTGVALYNSNIGTVTVSGTATVTSESKGPNDTNRGAIFNQSTGEIKIEGGTVSNTATNGSAIYNASTGTITVSGGTVTSGNTETTSGTIHLVNVNALTVTGGTIINTAPNGNRIYPVISINIQPAAATNVFAEYISGSLAVAASAGGATVGYQWYSNATDSNTGGTPVATGGTSTNFVIPTDLSEGEYFYYCVVSGLAWMDPVATNTAKVTVVVPAVSYTVNSYGPGDSFLAVRDDTGEELKYNGSTTIPTTTALMTVLRTNANGANCSIQFGVEPYPLFSAGTGCVLFENVGASTWGLVLIKGRLTSANATDSPVQGTVSVNNVSIISVADITCTSAAGRAITNLGNGAVTISGGTVSVAGSGAAIRNNVASIINITDGTVTTSGTGQAIRNQVGGTINISGGTVSATANGDVVSNYGAGAINIIGGRIEANGGVAVYNTNTATGKITVLGNAFITSKISGSEYGTITIADNGTATAERLVIFDGTIENTSTTANGNAVYNASTGAVTISGGTISTTATTGYAVKNTGTGKITITGSTTITATSESTKFNGSNITVNGVAVP